MLGVISDTWGVSFRKVGALLTRGLAELGYRDVRYVDGRVPLLPTGRWARAFVVGDTVMCIAWRWHRYHAHFCEKCVWWTDTPLDLEHVPDREIEFVNEHWCVVAVSRFEYARMRARGFRVCGVVGRPINSAAIERALKSGDDSWRRRFGRYILTVGGDQVILPPRYPRKGLDRFDEAIGMIRGELRRRSIRVVAVSNWPYFRNVDVRIPFGSLSEDELYQLIRQCDLFVFPSRLEAFGLPVLEAMALGKIVVHANAPAYNEFAVGIGIPEDKLVEVRDFVPELGMWWRVYDYPARELADAILYALDMDEGERARIAARAREVAVQFYDYTVAQRLMEV